MKLSFVIPSRNSACWLAHALESCQKQTHQDLEIVVVDDASTDSTPRLMDFLVKQDIRIKAFRLATKHGRSAARNFGNRCATGDAILVLDADDIAYPNRAKLTERALKDADLVYGPCDRIDVLGTNLGTIGVAPFDRSAAIKNLTNGIVHSSMAYTKDLSLRFPYRGGDISDLGLDDWAFTLEAHFSGARFSQLPQTVGAYRGTSTGISKNRDEQKVKEAKLTFLETIKTAV